VPGVAPGLVVRGGGRGHGVDAGGDRLHDPGAAAASVTPGG
jgi:hypothetical protein